MTKFTLRWAAVAVLTAVGATNALAQGLDLSGIHEQRIEGGRLCMSDHFHYGNSSGLPSRKAAEAEAIASWAGFTAFEYGPAWANYRLAASRTMNCRQAGNAWSCDTEARPCRTGGTGRPRTK